MTCHFLELALRRPGRVVLPLLFGLLGLGLSSCAGSPSALAPASPQAARIANLFWSVFGIAAAIFVVTEVLLILAVVRFRDRRGAAEPAQTHGNLRLEIGWTIVPALILAGVFLAMLPVMNVVSESGPNALQIRVIGHQWWWEVQYPELGINTASDIHVEAGRPVRVELVAADVIHSFWVPELNGKVDLIPGHLNTIAFTPERPGIFRGQCAEYCGTQHANMAFEVIAEPADQFNAWVQATRAQLAQPAPNSEAAQGMQTFLSGVCIGCHTIDGSTAMGKLGPNLTHFGSRRSIAALTLENTPDNLAKWLGDPQAVKQGNLMRIPELSADQVKALTAFLSELK